MYTDEFDDESTSDIQHRQNLFNSLFEEKEKSKFQAKEVRLELVKSMIVAGLSTELIECCTTISEEEVEKIRNASLRF